MNHPLMKCGHTAQGTMGGNPVCVICMPDERAMIADDELPSLNNRFARCHDDSTIVPSSIDLAFFEYRGPNSRDSIESCANCSYSFLGHLTVSENPHAAASHTYHNVNCRHCNNFTPHGPFEYDRYYCGHGGWD